jgi:hypothetical protein
VDINELAAKVRAQADRLFPNRTDSSMFLKMYSELGEMTERPDDPMEVADAFILLLDYAHRKGINIRQVVEFKMAVNDNRSWIVNEMGVMRHDKLFNPGEPS